MATISIRVFFVVLLLIGVNNAQLNSTFYSSTCPNLLSIISTAVNNAVSSEPRMGASLLRLHFHDCFVNGCDASVLLDDTSNFIGEKTAAPNNNSLRGFHVIDDIKDEVEWWCPGVVSCADILAVAARDGVVALGGPSWTVPLGRRDSTTASLASANSELPSPFSSLDALVQSFSGKGFTASEMVALSGAHTIGSASCRIFRQRIYSEATIDATYAAELQAICPGSAGTGDDIQSPLDSSAADFDNQYFADLQRSRGLLHSDQELFSNGSTDGQVSAYAGESAAFFCDFAEAMVKMASLSPLTGGDGEVRENCRRTN